MDKASLPTQIAKLAHRVDELEPPSRASLSARAFHRQVEVADAVRRHLELADVAHHGTISALVRGRPRASAGRRGEVMMANIRFLTPNLWTFGRTLDVEIP